MPDWARGTVAHRRSHQEQAIMDSVFGAATVYIALLLLFRISGKRTVGDISTFDFVLLLIISESVQQAMVGRDQSMTHGLLLVTTLIGLDVALSLWRRRKGARALAGIASACRRRERAAARGADVEDACGRERHPRGGARASRPRAHGPDQIRRRREQRQDQHHPVGTAVTRLVRDGRPLVGGRARARGRASLNAP